MPKYDAFGREIGEDTLEGLGSTSSPQPSAEPRPAERPDPDPGWQEAPPQPPPAGDEPRRQQLAGQLTSVLAQAAEAQRAGRTVTVRRSGAARGCLIAFVVLLVVLGGITLAIVSLVSSVDVDGDAIISRPKIVAPEPAPKGLDSRSLMRPAAVAAALEQLRRTNTRLTNLRLAPERIDATLLTSEGRLRHVQVKPGGKLERFGTDSGAGFDSVGTIPFDRLDPRAPARLARRGAEEHGVPIAELQYAVPQDISGEVRWVVYFTRSRYVLGDAKGRFERKLP